MYITLSEAKRHLNIDADFTADDSYVISLIEVGEAAVAAHLDMRLADIVVGGQLPAPVRQSVLLMVANLYANREPVSYASAVKVPYTMEYLLDMYRKQYCP